MKRYFIVSLCHGGVLGGGIVADDESITYRTNKLTVSQKYRNLEMKYCDIQGFSRKWVLCFPIFSINMKSGETYKFLVFNPKRFSNLLNEKTGTAV